MICYHWIIMSGSLRALKQQLCNSSQGFFFNRCSNFIFKSLALDSFLYNRCMILTLELLRNCCKSIVFFCWNNLRYLFFVRIFVCFHPIRKWTTFILNKEISYKELLPNYEIILIEVDTEIQINSSNHAILLNIWIFEIHASIPGTSTLVWQCNRA